MITRFIAALLIASSTCSIICGSACDFIETGECLDRGELFGPCKSGQCTAGLSCLASDVGDMCVPPETWAAHDEVPACAHWRGTLGCNSKTDQCFLQCTTQAECVGGTVCDKSIGKCVYPFDEPGECGKPGGMFGPCIDDECYLGLACFGTASGNACVPPASEADAWFISECAGIVGNALVCFEDEWFCAAACNSDDDCDGTICDSHTKTCVHPWE